MELIEVGLWGYLETDNLQSGTEKADTTYKKNTPELRGRGMRNKELARK